MQSVQKKEKTKKNFYEILLIHISETALRDFLKIWDLASPKWRLTT